MKDFSQALNQLRMILMGPRARMNPMVCLAVFRAYILNWTNISS